MTFDPSNLALVGLGSSTPLLKEARELCQKLQDDLVAEQEQNAKLLRLAERQQDLLAALEQRYVETGQRIQQYLVREVLQWRQTLAFADQSGATGTLTLGYYNALQAVHTKLFGAPVPEDQKGARP